MSASIQTITAVSVTYHRGCDWRSAGYRQ
jgi:hypothetical protein